MKGLAILLCGGLLNLALSSTVSAASVHEKAGSQTGSPSVKVLSVIGPQKIGKTGPAITVHVRVTGVRLDPTHIGRKSVDSHGHMQLYLDRIPAGAYRKADLKQVVAIAAGPTF